MGKFQVAMLLVTVTLFADKSGETGVDSTRASVNPRWAARKGDDGGCRDVGCDPAAVRGACYRG